MCCTHISYTYYTRYSIYIYVYVLFDSLVLRFPSFITNFCRLHILVSSSKCVCLRLLSLVEISVLLFIHSLLDLTFQLLGVGKKHNTHIRGRALARSFVRLVFVLYSIHFWKNFFFFHLLLVLRNAFAIFSAENPLFFKEITILHQTICAIR